MTRINIIPPRLLTDQHLVAEKFEITWINGYLNRTKKSKKGLLNINSYPKEFSLNTNHVKFFYDKGLYLEKRFNSLKEECNRRRIRNENSFDKSSWENLEPIWFKDYTPSKKDYSIILERIKERVNKKPNWYKFHKNHLDLEKYFSLLDKFFAEQF